MAPWRQLGSAAPGRTRWRSAPGLCPASCLRWPEALELLCPLDRRHPMMARRRMELRHGCGKIWIREVPNCDHRDCAPFKRPEHRGSTRRTKVITDVGPVCRTDTVDLQAVIDLGCTGDRNFRIIREDRADLKCTARTLLAEIAVAGQNRQGLLLDSDADSSTSAFGGSRHGLHVRADFDL